MGVHRRVGVGPQASGKVGSRLRSKAGHGAPSAQWREGFAVQRGACVEVRATAAAGRGSHGATHPQPVGAERAQNLLAFLQVRLEDTEGGYPERHSLG